MSAEKSNNNKLINYFKESFKPDMRSLVALPGVYHGSLRYLEVAVPIETDSRLYEGDEVKIANSAETLSPPVGKT